jgi:malate dehydrogenase (oxaloacetate-decarboxylating)
MGSSTPHRTLEDQGSTQRVLDAAHRFCKYSNMRDLQDNDETLFYSTIEHCLRELLPIVYTPTVGEDASLQIWRRPAGCSSAIPTGIASIDSLRLTL